MISFGLKGHCINISHGGQTVAVCKRWLAGSMAWMELHCVTADAYETFSVRCVLSNPTGVFVLLGMVPGIEECDTFDDRFILRLLENDCVQTIGEDELSGLTALFENELREHPAWGREEAQRYLGKMPEYKELEVKPR